MKKNIGYTAYVVTGFALAAVIFLALFPVNAGPQAVLAQDIPGVNTPVVTVRLVETRIIRTALTLPVTENPVAEIPVEEGMTGNAAAFDFQPPEAPAVQAPPAINLIVPPDAAYHLEPLKQQPARVILVH